MTTLTAFIGLGVTFVTTIIGATAWLTMKLARVEQRLDDMPERMNGKILAAISAHEHGLHR